MSFELFVVLETLENVVSWDEIFHTTIYYSLKLRSRLHLGATAIFNHIINLLEPERHQICIFVANKTHLATNFAHAVSTEESVLIGETKFQIIRHFVHAPGLVHLCNGVVIVGARFLATSLKNPLKMIQ